MTFADYSMHAVNPIAAGPAPAAATASGDEGGFSFDDLLDIVNPLQHLPVVGTLYRAITGDRIKTFPKIAGDALYGGFLGFAGSLADSMFEKVTGKNFGDTVLAAVEDAFSPSDAAPTGLARAAAPPVDTTATPVASTAPALPAPGNVAPAALDTLMVPGQDALLTALSRNAVGPDTATRAALAYRRSLNVAPGAVPQPAVRATVGQ
ncbi:MAG: hypothetical protein WDN01_16085 [Rhizomicrobium sp.]